MNRRPTGRATLLASTPHQLYIAGDWVDATNGTTFAVRDPANGEVVREGADATAADAVRALGAAVAAQDEWASTPLRTRSDILRRTFDLVSPETVPSSARRSSARCSRSLPSPTRTRP